ncbi:MAG TPA: hypothetical protein VMM17_02210 [Gemmatimonadaceae bacterium]|nr:hypothetical protein [Gemmatimonadaceae bacterium]
MRCLIVLAALAALVAGQSLHAQPVTTVSIPTAGEQIALAVQAAPPAFREGAAVLGYRADGQLVRLRAGSNGIICLADDPKEVNFHASCYHRSLEPFMARGRQLRARPGGATSEVVDSIRLADIRAGRLRVPERAMLYQIFAPSDSVDVRTSSVRSPSYLHVVYLPYATTESTGLSTDPMRGTPWLMYPGKPWAHIMIGP